MHDVVVMTLGYLALVLVFLGIPLVMCLHAPLEARLKVFVISMFAPVFAWIALFIGVQGVSILLYGYQPWGYSCAWWVVFLALQASLAWILKKMGIFSSSHT